MNYVKIYRLENKDRIGPYRHESVDDHTNYYWWEDKNIHRPFNDDNDKLPIHFIWDLTKDIYISCFNSLEHYKSWFTTYERYILNCCGYHLRVYYTFNEYLKYSKNQGIVSVNKLYKKIGSDYVKVKYKKCKFK